MLISLLPRHYGPIGPVAQAVAKAKAQAEARWAQEQARQERGQAEREAKEIADVLAELHQNLTRISVKAYLTPDGERADVLLGDLALILGVGAEIGMHRDKGAPGTRRMHAALRTVLHMSCNGRRWDAGQAKVLHEAAVLAVEAFEADLVLGVAVMPGACQLAEEVRAGTARMDAVVGPEVYNAQPVCVMQASASSY
jgi:hypothetical protein